VTAVVPVVIGAVVEVAPWFQPVFKLIPTYPPGAAWVPVVFGAVNHLIRIGGYTCVVSALPSDISFAARVGATAGRWKAKSGNVGLSFLSNLRLRGVLGERRLSWISRSP
jgi:hypothetical protein